MSGFRVSTRIPGLKACIGSPASELLYNIWLRTYRVDGFIVSILVGSSTSEFLLDLRLRSLYEKYLAFYKISGFRVSTKISGLFRISGFRVSVEYVAFYSVSGFKVSIGSSTPEFL